MKSLTQEDILNQIPALICCTDLTRTIVFANKIATKTFGFKNQLESQGLLLENMPCKASSNAEIWGMQNTLVDNTKTTYRYIDIASFAGDKVLTFLTVKTPFEYGNDQVCVMAHATLLSGSLFLNLSMALTQSDKKFRTSGNINNRSYQCGSQFKDTKLSKRELECLFYLVRGKTALEISQILQLSKRTIESYTENIKSKLHCETKSDLIEIALDNHFIDFIPESLLENFKMQRSIFLSAE